jgi:hypothetical protein
MAGFKAGMKIPGQAGLGFNSCIFATAEEAAGAGSELMSRWYIPEGYEVVVVEGAPNYALVDGKPKRLEEDE